MVLPALERVVQEPHLRLHRRAQLLRDLAELQLLLLVLAVLERARRVLVLLLRHRAPTLRLRRAQRRLVLRARLLRRLQLS